MRKQYLSFKKLPLPRFVEAAIMIIKPDFAYRNAFFVAQKSLYNFVIVVFCFFRRVEPCSKINVAKILCKFRRL